MEFDEEWAVLRARAAEQQETSMRLNQLPAESSGPTPGGGSPDFGSSPAEKKTAANTIENELEPNTKKATDWADEASSTAVKTFDGWQTSAGLKKVQKTWDQQVRTLMGRLSSEKTALRGASGYFAQNDFGIRGQFAAVSKSKIDGV
ncbi:hypothetical protein [Streptomyces sp. CC210A]|uniref:hypothetical protein n=1 Tax=Streptomyces sp. CC210A TaxID=2898184 RepID=UPI001F225A0B|nr:hypothetical protein [Streptomyces sp. CC210A]